MGLTDRGDGSPPEGFSHCSTEIGKAVPICERRNAGSADDGVELLLAFSLFVWVSDHGQHEPGQSGRSLQTTMSKGWGWGSKDRQLTVSEPAMLGGVRARTVLEV